jgi:3D-(3,5/4)-trihydroxycyclohexane-1,2-dione acylhydrolase (decyclizing)
MGYEIAGGWGVKMANPDRDVIVMVGDGSYLMMNSDIYSSVLTGHKLIVVVCDNGGFAVIDRLQTFKGGAHFNNLIEHCRTARQAFARAKQADRTYVIHIKVQASQWTPGDAWWDVAVPAVSQRESVRKAAADHAEGKRKQRVGV